MSTHSAIIAKFGDKDYRGIYCHFDGYWEGVGETLESRFNSEEQAKELIKLGDCSTITEERVRDYASLGEDWHQTVGKTWREVANEIDNSGNIYLWENGRWNKR